MIDTISPEDAACDAIERATGMHWQVHWEGPWRYIAYTTSGREIEVKDRQLKTLVKKAIDAYFRGPNSNLIED